MVPLCSRSHWLAPRSPHGVSLMTVCGFGGCDMECASKPLSVAGSSTGPALVCCVT